MHATRHRWEEPHPLLTGPEDVWETDAQVVAVWPEFHQVWLLTPEGNQLAITDQTKGVRLQTLRRGQLLRCTVTTQFPRVLAASVVG